MGRSFIKDKKISFRVSEEEEKFLIEQAKAKGYSNKSDFIRALCIDGKIKECSRSLENVKFANGRIYVRVSEDEKREICDNAKQAGLKLGRYVRNCCLGNSIIVIDGLKEFSKELNKVGVNLNQITRLCNEGLIECPDIVEVRNELKNVYKELGKLSKKARTGR